MPSASVSIFVQQASSAYRERENVPIAHAVIFNLKVNAVVASFVQIRCIQIRRGLKAVNIVRMVSLEVIQIM